MNDTEMDMDTSFADWADKLEAGTNHWLPAYGFQQPAELQEALLQQEKNMELFTNDGGALVSQQQAFLFLETILEETSDDLRSESDYSGPAGWPDSDSDTASVIHVVSLGTSNVTEWSGSERDLAVPKKRRRRTLNTDPGVHDDDDDDDDDCGICSSRSSSLLQFETLERHCENIFRTSASSEPFLHSPSIASSSFSFDSLETTKWRFSGSQDSLEDDASSMTSSCASSSDVTSSDEDTINRSISSRSGNCSFRSSSGLRTFRSFDSLNLYQHSDKSEGSFLSGEFSQSLNNNSMPVEDPGEPVPAPRGIYKTVECLTEVTPHVGCGKTAKGSQNNVTETNKQDNKDTTDGTKGSQRSAENLSEDSGFGEHIPRESSNNLARSCVYPIAEYDYTSSSSYYSDSSRESTTQVKEKVPNLTSDIEGDEKRGWDETCDEKVIFNQTWQSAPDLLRPIIQSQQRGWSNRTSAPNLCTFNNLISKNSIIINYIDKDDEDIVVIPETKSFVEESVKMAARCSVASTPNLYVATQEFLANERDSLLKSYTDSTVSLSRVLSLKKKYESESKLSTTSSKGSNIMITTSFVNLSNSGSSKCVQFCPVVSEVSWQDSFSTDGTDSSEEEDEVTGSESSTPPIDALVEILRGNTEPTPARNDVVQRRRVVEELHKWKQVKEEEKATPRGHVRKQHLTVERSVQTQTPAVMEEASVKPKKHGIGGFFSRFSFRRLSGRDKKKDKKDKKKQIHSNSVSSGSKVSSTLPSDVVEDVQIIPLHPPTDDVDLSALVSKPPLPPRTPSSDKQPQRRLEQPRNLPSNSSDMASVTATRGLLETDLDSDIPTPNKKTRSLLNLDDGRAMLKPSPVPREDNNGCDSRAKSMEFLLDKENQAAIKPPENELQKVGVGGERIMSEHQLRVQRSLQRLNVPDWYRNSNLPAQGFLLKRNSDAGISPVQTGSGWPGLSNKTTSLSSLGSTQSAAPRSPTSNILSPSPTSQVFSRWSTSRLSSGATSTSTSPCGSTRSSFNYRTPYLGWRSQERLSRPRTPAERLAAGLLPQKPQEQNAPNLNEVRSSIKEVTSAIVHYVSGSKTDSSDRLSPALGTRWDRDTSSSRSASPRGSTGRLCWLESSFVGSRPLDVPETPGTGGRDLYLELNSHSRSHDNTQANGELLLH